MPKVDIAVSVGRSVVQDIGGTARAGSASLLVNAGFGPMFQQLRLQLRQVGLHGKGGLRQVHRGL